jgi:two-component system, sensor histidine kinase ChiS
MAETPKILIIDDEKDFCHFIRLNLEGTKKYKVYTSTTAQNGVETAIRKKPDLIFLDIMMPKMSGFQVLQLLKQNIVTTSIPVVMLTALDQDESKIEASSLYCHDYLIKPIEMETLIAKIDSVLFAHRAGRP